MSSPTYDGIDVRPLQAPPVDALLLVSFGGPEAPEDVLPFMENVTRGRGIPRRPAWRRSAATTSTSSAG